jgi:Family of unknown function (DUF6074)
MKREKIIAFPFARRRGVVRRLAQQMAMREPVAAEKYLQQQLQRQINALHRRQVSDCAVEQEIRALKAAVRTELWRFVLTPSATPPGGA